MTQVPVFLTVKQVGDRLNASGDAVRAWCRDGKLVIRSNGSLYQAIKLPSGEYRIPTVIVDAIERGTFHPDGQPATLTGDAA